MKTFSKAFGDRIMELLILHKMSKYRLEKETGIDHSNMSNYFNGKQKDVRLSTVAKVASVFGMTLEQFFASEHFNLVYIDFE